jgi:hypothetical protein
MSEQVAWNDDYYGEKLKIAQREEEACGLL